MSNRLSELFIPSMGGGILATSIMGILLHFLGLSYPILMQAFVALAGIVGAFMYLRTQYKNKGETKLPLDET